MDADVSNLGELEMAVLEYVWVNGPTSVKAAHLEIGEDRGITHNTVQSTLKRLWEKGLLTRHKESHAYIYSECVSRRQLTECMVEELIDQVAGEDVQVALEAFVNLADRAGEDTLATLEALVAAKRRSQAK